MWSAASESEMKRLDTGAAAEAAAQVCVIAVGMRGVVVWSMCLCGCGDEQVFFCSFFFFLLVWLLLLFCCCCCWWWWCWLPTLAFERLWSCIFVVVEFNAACCVFVASLPAATCLLQSFSFCRSHLYCFAVALWR